MTMAMATVTVKVDAETKAKAASIVDDLGLDLSSVTRAFYRQIVRERRIPLSLSYAATPEAAENIRVAADMIASGQSRFSNAEDMFSALGI